MSTVEGKPGVPDLKIGDVPIHLTVKVGQRKRKLVDLHTYHTVNWKPFFSNFPSNKVEIRMNDAI